jgi:hypothetical protein
MACWLQPPWLDVGELVFLVRTFVISPIPASPLLN